MGTKSQNGWPAYPSTLGLTRGSACGFGFWAANKDVRFIFERWITWFDKNIEKIAGRVLDDWSYANRMVRGSSSVVSNHGSATAIDMNALAHGRGSRDTFTDEEQARIHAELKKYKGVLRWGGDFNTTVDDMHFEINADQEAVAVLVSEFNRLDKIQEDDVSFKDKHKLTTFDVAAYGDASLKPGESKSYDEIVRFPPATARVRREMNDRMDKLEEKLDNLIELLAAPKSTKKSG